VNKVVVGLIPCPSTSIVGEPELKLIRGRLSLSFVFEDDDDVRFAAGVEFDSVRAFRKRSERLCTAWHIEDAYDSVVEVGDSLWVTELRADAQGVWRDQFAPRHFMIYLDSFGALEVVAGSAVVLPARVLVDG
jgi:hypothetical protein